MKVIKYKEASYPAREIKLDNKIVLVSILDLQNALIDTNGDYVDNEAKYVDDKIFYYLAPSEFMLPTNEIKKLLINI